MDDFSFSVAKKSELNEIMAIYHSLIGDFWSLEYPNEEIAIFDIENEFLFTLKNKNNEIISVISVEEAEDDLDFEWKHKKTMIFARLAVVTHMQNKGIANFMLNRTIEEMRAKGHIAVGLLVRKTHEKAISIYEKNDFSHVGEVFMYGSDFYCYEKEV